MLKGNYFQEETQGEHQRPFSKIVTRTTPILIYVLLSIAFFARALSHPGTWYVGTGPDPLLFIWDLQWWAHTILQGHPTLTTHHVFSPWGINMMWMTSIPVLGIMMTPITAIWGPLASYNTLSVFMPSASASASYLVFLRWGKSPYASALGGYLWGFSSYELGQMLGHINLSCTFLIPLVADAAFQRVSNHISTHRFMGLTGLYLALELGISTEVFATLSLVGGLCVAFAILFRQARLNFIIEIMGAYIVALVIDLPFVIALWHGPFLTLPVNFSQWYSLDLLNLFIPTYLSNWGGHAFWPISRLFAGNLFEQGGYLGIPLLFFVVSFGYQNRLQLHFRWIYATLVSIIVLALGSHLYIAGQATVPLPWSVVAKLPILRDVLPVRFMVYADFFIAYLMTEWFRTISRIKMAAVFVVICSLWPASHMGAGWYFSRFRIPQFFQKSRDYQSFIRPNQTVLILPYGTPSHAMTDQAATNFFFKMPEGYVSAFLPPRFRNMTIIPKLENPSQLTVKQRPLLSSFLQKTHTSLIISTTQPTAAENTLFSTLGMAVTAVGGVYVYTPARTRSYPSPH